MSGEMSVGIVFIESSQAGGPTFSSTERNEICVEITTGLRWLVDQHPSHGLSWVTDLQFVTINLANQPDTGDGDNHQHGNVLARSRIATS